MLKGKGKRNPHIWRHASGNFFLPLGNICGSLFLSGEKTCLWISPTRKSLSASTAPGRNRCSPTSGVKIPGTWPKAKGVGLEKGGNYARKATQPGRKFQQGSSLCQPWPQRKILRPLKAVQMAREAVASLATQTSLDRWIPPSPAKANLLLVQQYTGHASICTEAGLCARQLLVVRKELGKSSQTFSDCLSGCLRLNH